MKGGLYLDGDVKTEYMITTLDNPWSPFTHYREWWEFDREHGYFTQEKLAKLAFTTDNLGENEKQADIAFAQQLLLDSDILGIYIRVTKDTVLHPVSIEEYLSIVESDI